MKCPKCGVGNPPSQSHCKVCGAALTDGQNQGPGIPVMPPQKSGAPAWVWVLVAFAALGACAIPILAAILFPVFEQARLAAEATVQLSDAKQVCLASLIYSGDFDDRYPPFTRDVEMGNYLAPYLTSVGKDRSKELIDKAASYSWNPAASGAKAAVEAQPAWVFYDPEG